MPILGLDESLASRFAASTLANVGREFPNKLDHVIAGPADVKSPRQLHPIFFGCFDWHSCVHGYWQLARLIRLFPTLPQRAAIERKFDEMFTPELVQAEIDYFIAPSNRGFERPYGWAWLLELATELHHPTADGRSRWHAALLPLAERVATSFIDFLPKATYPTRVGTHGNSAFALTLAHAYAVAHGDHELRDRICKKVDAWYGGDANCQAWEPSLDEFLSPALMEAACVQAIVPAERFVPWLDRFLPGLSRREPRTLFIPATASDRTDGKIAHLDGLNFSRAWCMRRIAGALKGRVEESILTQSADAHVAASLPHIAVHYAGEHWLATFALLAMS